MWKLSYVVVHKGNVGRVDGDVAANAAHSYTGVGTLEGRGIVYAVSYHAYAALGAVLVYKTYFILRQALGVYALYANTRRYCIGCSGMVTC